MVELEWGLSKDPITFIRCTLGGIGTPDYKKVKDSCCKAPLPARRLQKNIQGKEEQETNNILNKKEK